MSRIERHKHRREGHITGVDTDLINLEIIEEVNLEQETEVNAKRRRVISPPTCIANEDFDKLKQDANATKNEVFDIDKVNLKTRSNSLDDTQLDIMKNIFSNNNVEFNDTSELKKDVVHHALSEEELNELLSKKEVIHNKKLNKIRKKDLKKDDEKFEEYQKNDSVLSRNIDFENKPLFKNNVLWIVFIVLVLVLIYLIYSFMKK